MSRPFTTRRLIPTMPALAIALALTVPAALAPAQAAPQAIQDAVYEPSADSPDGYNPVNAWSVNVEMSGGQMRWQSGCLPYGTATYEAKDDGTWRFSRGDLSTKGCPGDMAQAANELIKLMEGANRWRREDFGKIGLVGGPTALHLSPYDSPPQVPVPDDPSVVPQLLGDWRVESGPTPDSYAAGPFGWVFTVEPGSVSIPKGCNTPAGANYLATASGGFALQSGRFFTLVGCDTLGTQSESLFHALAATQRWSQPSPDRLVLTGAKTRIELARPAPTNAGLAVKALRTSSTTVRVAAGQTVKLPLAADAAASLVTEATTLTWKNSRGAVAQPWTVKRPAKAVKTGSLAVSMQDGKSAWLNITGKKKGTSRLTVTAPSGVSLSFKIIVTAKKVKPTKLTIVKVGELEGGKLKLGVKVRPAKATGATVRWTSSNPSSVTVDQTGLASRVGWVVPVPGTDPVTITAKVGKLTATFTMP